MTRMAADAKELLSASIRVIRGQAPHSEFCILHSAFSILPSLCRASPSASYNQNLDPKRCVSITDSNASTYQMYHSDTFDNFLSHSMFQNHLFAPHPAD